MLAACRCPMNFTLLCTLRLSTFVNIAKMVLEAGYANTTGFRKVTKVTILVKKKPGMSDEDFVEHYNKKHAQMAADVLLKHHVITYSLVGSRYLPFCSL